jgi:hypothetical protein
MVCRHCGKRNGLRRENRAGFFQLHIFPSLGLYPWECIFCRKVRLYRGRVDPNGGYLGESAKANSSAPAGSSAGAKETV